MKHISAHVNAAGGVENAPLNAQRIGATAFALSTKNQRQWHARPLSENSITAFKQNLRQVGIAPKHVLPHDSHLINLGHPETSALNKSRRAMVLETVDRSLWWPSVRLPVSAYQGMKVLMNDMGRETLWLMLDMSPRMLCVVTVIA